ncbi:MAG TPA: M20/M25/M40 family metallo-hydrolase [Vicinamibacterales bacterium]|nr:M20/M25/M40 family metallo-hydrolase [Vicinamibacterales bacterium]
MSYRRVATLAIALFVAVPSGIELRAGQALPAATGQAITEQELREHLTYIASDALEGRATYSEGLGLAAAYIARHLEQWGVQPGGDNGTYFQRVPSLGVRTTRRSTVTVTAGGQTRTFKDADGFLLPANQGAAQSLTFGAVEFVGYGLSLPGADHDDYAGADVKGKLVLFTGRTPAALASGQYGRLLNARGRLAVEQGAAAVIQATGWTAPAAAAPPVPAGRGGRGAAPPAPDFTTAEPLDRHVAPVVNAGDALAAFLLSAAPVGAAEIQRRAAAGEPLARVTIPAAVRIDVAPEYQIVRTQYSRNVIGIVPGADPALSRTYVAFGAHYDHVGVLEGAPRGNNPRARPDDRIFNGADDDGSGTVALMALANAFARGERTKRSLMFVWHTAEEGGLRGSRFNAQQVDPDAVVAVLNMDMIGRNANDDPANANQLFIIGADRISTDLHNINEDANAALAAPLALDYALNDPADPESLYTRSDHYSYAARGIPIVFFFTGLHPDYHQVSDEVDKINFPKLAGITRLVHETGRRVANRDRAPARDHKGPRAGKGFKGKLR